MCVYVCGFFQFDNLKFFVYLYIILNFYNMQIKGENLYLFDFSFVVCLAGLASSGREEGPFLEQRAWTGFALKKHFMQILYLIVCVGQNHHLSMLLTLAKDHMKRVWKRGGRAFTAR